MGDISYFTLYNSTKANTLSLLKPRLKKSSIEEIFVFFMFDSLDDKRSYLNDLSSYDLDSIEPDLIIENKLLSESNAYDNNFTDQQLNAAITQLNYEISN